MNTKHTLKYAEEPGLDDLFVVKKFNEWMLERRDEPVPKMLFGSLWREGEIAVLSADPGAGKSLLAVQIAESIAGGKFFSSPPYEGGVAPASGDGVVLCKSPHAGISTDPHAENHPVGETPTPLLRKEGSLLAEDEPFACTARPQEVLYLNLKLTPTQFKMRYAAEHEAEDGDVLKNLYQFSKKLHRVDINIHAKLPDGYKTFDEVLPVLVERLVAKKKAKVVIIDNITYLQRSVYGYRETYTMMKALHALKSRLGISILVLARTSKYGSVCDSAAGSCSALFSRFADSVFMIGKSKLDPSARFIKQLIVHSSQAIYNSDHVASFVLTRAGGNFLQFKHYGFCPEIEHKQPISDDRLWPTIDKVKILSDEGKSIREIAVALDVPKSSVHRYLQMWTPEIGAAVNPKPKLPTRSTANVAETARQEGYPGGREYGEAMEDPRFDPLYDEEADENSYQYRLLNREAWLIEEASARASEIYEETGVAPKLADDPEYAEFKKIVAAGGDPFAEDHNTDEPVHAAGESSDLDDNTDPVAKARISCKSSQAAWRRAAASGETLPGLEYEINDHGCETWIEKRDERRKPVVWYSFNSKGRKQKHVRDSFGVSIKTESGPQIE